ncbi:MAG: CDP-diacylglycerol--glycerol-3-phosphate 3-phosphatidyltransferase [Bdellovibrionales bacterium]|nr:CDP-diacylglycerol--glycerol-3-phosphate 3-phosphatidyltransferase [Bdellovibrionales bacterium]
MAEADETGEITNATRQNDLEFGTLPNILTSLRVIMIPAIIWLLMQKTNLTDIIAGFTFAAAGVTDYFDGYFARKYKTESVFGKLMDPLADKFLVVSSLCMLQELGRIPALLVITLICREMAITGLRALASSEGLIIGASQSAKWKTATQMVAIPWLMAREGLWGIPLFQMGQVLIYVSLAISLWSAKDYVVDFFVAIREKRKKKREAKREARKLRREKLKTSKA